ncbi:MAG TPA: TolC family protein [Thermoanaerobaculia bacterium]|nr:TolC family protein [Thermoanaerobaculia bacterium]
MRRLAVLIALLTSCASMHRSVGTSQSPATLWTPPANAIPDATPQRAKDLVLPANFTPGMPITLAQVVDIALSNNTTTRIAWLEARAAEAALGSRESAYLPEVDVNASITRSRGTAQGGRTAFQQTTYGPSLALTYLLFDFGGREAQVEQARQGLIAANFVHNQSIQDVILQTEQAYYSYLDARALLAAQDATIKERKTSLDAADARHRAGVATVADVLQARTALSQAQLTRETIEGNLRTIEGLLATTMGLPATARFDFGELPLEVPAREVTEAVDALIARAITERPDLAAVRANADRARARIREVRAQGLPTIGLAGSTGVTWFGGGSSTKPYSASIALRWPLFTGFRNTYDIREAELEAQVAREDIRALEQRVNLQVWTSYFSLQTATQRLTTARDLLNSAQQSAEVATGRYRSGVGSILDVLTAESALENARAQEVQARTDWFLSVAQLAHDTGTLERLK